MSKRPESTRPRGRPALPAEKAKRHAVGIRTTKEIKDLLQEAADSSGRSLAQECELRLERSLISDREATMYGRSSLALAEIVSRAMLRAGDIAMYFATEGRTAFGGDWTSDPFAFNQARQAVDAIFAAIAPDGSPVLQGHSPEFAADVGKTVSKSLLDALAAPDCPGELGHWARWPREWLSIPAIERLRAPSAKKEGGAS
jgi:hypothetical protein